MISLYPVNPVQDIVSGRIFCQDRIAHFYGRRLHQKSLVTVVLEERSHGKATQSQCDRMAFVQHFDHLGEEVGIGELNLRGCKRYLGHIAGSL